GADARVVEDALPEFVPSDSLGQALVDPATHHEYGYGGWERELPIPIRWQAPSGQSAYGLVVAVHRDSLLQITLDYQRFYEAGGAYYTYRAEAEEHGKPEQRDYPVLEIVSPPLAFYPGEWSQWDAASMQKLSDDTYEAVAAAGGKIIGHGKTIADVLLAKDGWEVNPLVADAKIDPPLAGRWKGFSHTQFTVGVPVGGILHLLEYVTGMRQRGFFDQLVDPASQFGRVLAQRFAEQQGGAARSSMDATGLQRDPLVREVWGYGWLVFNHVAVVPYQLAAKVRVIPKNLLPAALRNPFGEVRKALHPTVQQFFEDNAGRIGQLFQETLAAVVSTVPGAERGVVDNVFGVAVGAQTVGDYLTYALSGRGYVSQWDGVGMGGTAYSTVKDHLGTPLVLLEIRQLGRAAGLMRSKDIAEQFALLASHMRPFFLEDQSRLWRRAISAHPEGAALLGRSPQSLTRVLRDAVQEGVALDSRSPETVDSVVQQLRGRVTEDAWRRALGPLKMDGLVDLRAGSTFQWALQQAASMGLVLDPSEPSTVAYVGQKLRDVTQGTWSPQVWRVGVDLRPGLRALLANTQEFSPKALANLVRALESWGINEVPAGVEGSDASGAVVKSAGSVPVVYPARTNGGAVNAVVPRVVRVLDRAGLTGVVSDVVAARAVADGVQASVEECLELLVELREGLFPQGVASPRAVDDSVVGVGVAAGGLVVDGWRPVRDWDALGSALLGMGPGAAALVLVRRVRGVGHAFAAYVPKPARADEPPTVVWVDFQQPDMARRVSDVPPSLAPVEARAVVIGADARVVEDALPEFVPSDSLGQALVDPAVHHLYGGAGWEKEWNIVIHWPGQRDFGKEVAVHRPSGAKIVLDYTRLYRVGDKVYVSRRDAAQHGEPIPFMAAIAEFVSAPANMLPHERFAYSMTAMQELTDSTERLLMAASGQTIGQAFQDAEGWEVRPDFREILVGPSAVGHGAEKTYTQFTVGVPVTGILPLLERVRSLRPKETDPLTGPSREFGLELVKRFVAEYPQHVRQVAGGISTSDPLVRELWGYGWLLFNHVAASSYVRVTESRMLIKNVLSVAARNPFGALREFLAEPVRQFLAENVADIRTLFAKTFTEYIEGAWPQKSANLSSSFMDAALHWESYATVDDYLRYGLTGQRPVSQYIGVGMSNNPAYANVSEHLGTPLPLLEIRYFGPRDGWIRNEEFSQYLREIVRTVHPYFVDDQTRLWRQALSPLLGADLANSQQYRPDTRLWEALQAAARRGHVLDPRSQGTVDFVALRLRQAAPGVSNPEVRRVEVATSIRAGLQEVYKQERDRLSPKAREALARALRSWGVNVVPARTEGWDASGAVVKSAGSVPVVYPARTAGGAVNAVVPRVVRVLDRAGLTGVVSDVLAARTAAVADGVPASVEECLELLVGLREGLFPQGVASPRTVEDSVVGAGVLVVGGWRPVRDWDALGSALSGMGPGAAALVLVRRPRGVGHAFAAYVPEPARPGERPLVVWVDLQQPDMARRVSEVPPSLTPVEARAVVISADARVVEDALPEFVPSESLGQALIDPATHHQYAGMGQERELDVFLEDLEGDEYGTTVAIHESGAKLDIDYGNYFEFRNQYFSSVEEALLAGGAPGDIRKVRAPLLEYISPPASIHPGERHRLQWADVARHSNETNELLQTVPLGSTLLEALHERSGWVVSDRFKKVRIVVRTRSSRESSFVQHTVGVPVDGLYTMLRLVEERSYNSVQRTLLAHGRVFGRELATHFVEQTLGLSLQPGEIELLSQDWRVREIWGYGWLVFTQASAASYVRKNNDAVRLVKNALAAALRNPIGRLRDELQDDVAEFLATRKGVVADLFVRHLWPLVRDEEAPVEVTPEISQGLLDSQLTAYHSVRDYLDFALVEDADEVNQRAAIGMNNLPAYDSLDTNSGVPLALLELRNYGRRGGWMTENEIQGYANEIIHIAQRAFEEHYRGELRPDLRQVIQTLRRDQHMIRTRGAFTALSRAQGQPWQEDVGAYFARVLSEHVLWGRPLPERVAEQAESVLQGRNLRVGTSVPPEMATAMNSIREIVRRGRQSAPGPQAQRVRPGGQQALNTPAVPRTAQRPAGTEALADAVYPRPSRAVLNSWMAEFRLASETLGREPRAAELRERAWNTIV
ncbi:hypothetical protein ABZ614_46195, partial [Streptomyces sp. NPDC013178]|uniref:hypothetical protein n=1 Tax=Streptomyces sp. NPDC013178 TaxID=3155118 RepID=UPI0033E2DC5C